MRDLKLPWTVRYGDTTIRDAEGDVIADWYQSEFAEASIAAMNASQSKDRVLEWLASEHVGSSSKWLVHCLTGLRTDRRQEARYPCDDGDAERCAKACDALDLWPKLGTMREHGWSASHVGMVRRQREPNVLAATAETLPTRLFTIQTLDGRVIAEGKSAHEAWEKAAGFDGPVRMVVR